jgi:hypothetical protein
MKTLPKFENSFQERPFNPVKTSYRVTGGTEGAHGIPPLKN